ncbi:MAG: hypothetical protein RBJ76_19730 [Stenomitos frigidus ULC029]
MVCDIGILGVADVRSHKDDRLISIACAIGLAVCCLSIDVVTFSLAS